MPIMLMYTVQSLPGLSFESLCAGDEKGAEEE